MSISIKHWSRLDEKRKMLLFPFLKKVKRTRETGGWWWESISYGNVHAIEGQKSSATGQGLLQMRQGVSG